MRGAWSTLVTLGSFLGILVLAASMASDYVDTHGTFLLQGGSEVNMAMTTVGRMRSLIGHLQVR
jgi:hypothetical protein